MTGCTTAHPSGVPLKGGREPPALNEAGMPGGIGKGSIPARPDHDLRGSLESHPSANPWVRPKNPSTPLPAVRQDGSLKIAGQRGDE
jgi:hypothetical protein